MLDAPLSVGKFEDLTVRLTRQFSRLSRLMRRKRCDVGHFDYMERLYELCFCLTTRSLMSTTTSQTTQFVDTGGMQHRALYRFDLLEADGSSSRVVCQ